MFDKKLLNISHGCRIDWANMSGIVAVVVVVVVVAVVVVLVVVVVVVAAVLVLVVVVVVAAVVVVVVVAVVVSLVGQVLNHWIIRSPTFSEVAKIRTILTVPTRITMTCLRRGSKRRQWDRSGSRKTYWGWEYLKTSILRNFLRLKDFEFTSIYHRPMLSSISEDCSTADSSDPPALISRIQENLWRKIYDQPMIDCDSWMDKTPST